VQLLRVGDFLWEKICTSIPNHIIIDYFLNYFVISQKLKKLTILLDLLIALANGGSKLEAKTAQLARKPQV
jgi:hypothetical protein